MSVVVWRIGADTPEYTAEDMTGAGAKLTGGRWNRPGTPLVYCSSNIALCCLETVVHLNAGGLPLNRYLVQLSVPDEVWERAKILSATTAPAGWDAVPTGKVSLDYGDTWMASGSEALLLVPSVIVPEELNVLINPAHPDAGRIKASKVRRWTYDPRMMLAPDKPRAAARRRH